MPFCLTIPMLTDFARALCVLSRRLLHPAQWPGSIIALACLAGLSSGCILTRPRDQATPPKGFDEAPSGADAFALIAHRLLGNNPKADYQHQHIGLSNLAAMLGFKYAFNDCASLWVTEVNSQGEVRIHAPHANGRGAGCRENNKAALTVYEFRDWTLVGEARTTLEPYAAVPAGEPLAAPPPSATKDSQSQLSQINIEDGKLLMVTPEVVTVTGRNTSSAPQDLSVNYVRSLAKTHAISIATSQTHAVGAGIKVSAEGGFAPFAKVSAEISTNYTFSIMNQKTTTDTQAETTTVQCSSTVQQRPGCSYRLSITANYVRTKARYLAELRARPRHISISGALRESGDCQHKVHRRRSGSCAGELVKLSLGSEGLSYEADLAQRLAGGDGEWYWENLHAAPGQQQADGTAHIKILQDFIKHGDYDSFALRFEDVTESVTDCVASVEVIAGGERCQLEPPAVATKIQP